MNDIYFDERVRHSNIGNFGYELINTQRKLVCQEYEIDKLRIKAAMYHAFFFRNSDLAKNYVNKTRKIMMR